MCAHAVRWGCGAGVDVRFSCSYTALASPSCRLQHQTARLALSRGGDSHDFTGTVASGRTAISYDTMVGCACARDVQGRAAVEDGGLHPKLLANAQLVLDERKERRHHHREPAWVG